MDKEALKFAIENGIINVSYIQDEFEMNKREKILSKHRWAISQGKDGLWRTYLPDEQKRRVMIKRTTKKDVEDKVIAFYKKQEEKPKTFNDAYFMWRKFQDEMVSGNTISKYNTDYKRYFEKTQFSRTKIEDITEETIKIFIVRTVKSKKLCKEACKTLFGYIKNTIYSARKNKFMEDDPMEFLQAKNFYKYCTKTRKSNDTRVVSEENMNLLYKKFREDYIEKPDYIPTYAVHLATLTGMRVGEIAALRWDSITNNYIIIDKSEKYDRITKKYFIDKTKNEKERIFPITEEIKKLLGDVKKAEMSSGFLCEWVFCNQDGRIHAPMISSCSKNKCRQIGITEKGIHAYRRTINSKMRCDGVSSVVAASLLGHSPEVNEKYYTFDVCSLKEKAEIVENVTKNMIMAK